MALRAGVVTVLSMEQLERHVKNLIAAEGALADRARCEEDRDLAVFVLHEEDGLSVRRIAELYENKLVGRPHSTGEIGRRIQRGRRVAKGRREAGVAGGVTSNGKTSLLVA